MPILNHTSTNNNFFNLLMINLLLLLMTGLMTCGCATIMQTGQDNMTAQDTSGQIGDNAYFNFMRSEMESRDG